MAEELPEYRVTFTRIGRCGAANGSPAPQPLTTPARDGEDLINRILPYALRYLGSRDVGVTIDVDLTEGYIDAGGRVAGEFTIERTSP